MTLGAATRLLVSEEVRSTRTARHRSPTSDAVDPRRGACYLIEPAGRGSDGPPATWVRGCDGYRLPTWDEAAALGRADGFWVWDVGAAGVYRAWPDGDVPAGERRRALRFRGREPRPR